MFQMTADIKFQGFKSLKPSSCKWSRNIDNYSDTASITIPAICRFVDKDKTYENVVTGQKIIEGTKVEIYAGYDGTNTLRFKGFVNRINFKVPVEIECEGYSYQLRRKIINKTYSKTTVRKVLQDLIQGTDIKLSSKMPDSIVFEAMTFRNYTGVQVLDFLKEKYLLTVCFFFDQLYVGWRATYEAGLVKHRLNWNVVKDDSLLFNTFPGSIVHIELESRTPNGVYHRKRSSNVLKPGDVKRIKTFIHNDSDKQAAANDRQLYENRHGYSGSITGFLIPVVEPGMTTQIIDAKFEERNGRYFVESVAGEFSPAGGRQKIGIGFSL